MEEDKAASEAATSLISLKYERNIIKKSEESEIFNSTTSNSQDGKRGTEYVLEGEGCQIISKENFMQQAVKKTSESQIIKNKSHLSPGTGMKTFTAAEAHEMQTKHPDAKKKLSSKNSNPDKSNQKKEIGTPRNDVMVGKRVMMLMNGVQCYGTITNFKRSYEVLFDNGMTEEFLRRQLEAAVVRDEAEAASACKKKKAKSDA